MIEDVLIGCGGWLVFLSGERAGGEGMTRSNTFALEAAGKAAAGAAACLERAKQASGGGGRHKKWWLARGSAAFLGRSLAKRRRNYWQHRHFLFMLACESMRAIPIHPLQE